MRSYRFIDYATQGYILLVGLVVLFFHNATVPGWPWLVALRGAVLVLVHALIQGSVRRPGNKVLGFLRDFYPILLYTGFYRETGALNNLFVTGYLDSWFIVADQWLFGFQPSIVFMYRFPQLWLSEILYASYFSYYLMISGIGLALLLRDRRQFSHYISVVSFVFYCCFLTYILLPVMGPRIFFRDLTDYRLPAEMVAMASAPYFPESVQTGLFYQIMKFIYHVFESPGAAFPSSHVAIAWCTVYFSFRYLPRIRWWHFLTATLLSVSTVYGRYHYVVDVIAGLAAAAALTPLGNWLYRRYGEVRPDPEAGLDPPPATSAQRSRS